MSVEENNRLAKSINELFDEPSLKSIIEPLKAINKLIKIEEDRVEILYNSLTQDEKKNLLHRHLINKIVFFDDHDDKKRDEQEKKCIIDELNGDILTKLYNIKYYLDKKCVEESNKLFCQNSNK